jgi:2'-5' RNA ligase
VRDSPFRLCAPSSMRTFIAIDITAAIRESIRALLVELKQTEKRIRWSRPESLHITLKFLGEVPPKKIADLKACLTAIRTPAPFSISVQGSGFFPGERSPRVVWVGVDGGKELVTLASLIEQALEPMGIPREKRPYSAHLTLGRIDGAANINAVRELLRQKEPLSLGSFEANEYFLYESTPACGGSVYTKLARFEMAASGPSAGSV